MAMVSRALRCCGPSMTSRRKLYGKARNRSNKGMQPTTLTHCVPMLTFARGLSDQPGASAGVAADLALVRLCLPSAMDRAKETRCELIALLTLAFTTREASRPTFHV